MYITERSPVFRAISLVGMLKFSSLLLSSRLVA